MENVWDYPRPPAVEPCRRRVRVELAGVTIVDSTRALRVLETSHPPTIYLPPDDVAAGVLRPVPGRHTFCEWKGVASYYDVVVGDGVVGQEAVGGRVAAVAATAAWTYRDPDPAYRMLTDHVAFYPGRMDACWLDDERVTPQTSDFYGGWITADIAGLGR